MVKGLSGLVSRFGLGLSLHVDGDALADVVTRTYPIDALLHFTIPAVTAFNGVGGGWQQRIIQERQGLLEIRREQLLERLPQGLEAAYPATKESQLFQRGFGPAAPVKQAIDLVDDRTQGT